MAGDEVPDPKRLRLKGLSSTLEARKPPPWDDDPLPAAPLRAVVSEPARMTRIDGVPAMTVRLRARCAVRLLRGSRVRAPCSRAAAPPGARRRGVVHISAALRGGGCARRSRRGVARAHINSRV